MKHLILMVLTLANVVAFARGGDSVGSGGVLWACMSGPDKNIFNKGVLSDLFEAQKQYGWKLIADPGGDPLKIYVDRKAWLQQNLPELSQALQSRFEYVEAHQTWIDAELLSTQDFNNATKPEASECSQGVWTPVNIANFREEDQQVLIRKSLWQSPNLPSLDKAALLVHEAVYYWMRTHYGATNSDKARKITGLLFANEKPEKILAEVRKVLGAPIQGDGRYICVMRHSVRNQLYVAYHDSMDSAALTVRTRCQEDVEPRWCDRTSLECEEILGGQSRRCVSENSSTRKIFTAKGRVLLEAQFNAHMACYVGSQAQGPNKARYCPDLPFIECN